jgi:hypothetical protein
LLTATSVTRTKALGQKAHANAAKANSPPTHRHMITFRRR